MSQYTVSLGALMFLLTGFMWCFGCATRRQSLEMSFSLKNLVLTLLHSAITVDVSTCASLAERA